MQGQKEFAPADDTRDQPGTASDKKHRIKICAGSGYRCESDHIHEKPESRMPSEFSTEDPEAHLICFPGIAGLAGCHQILRIINVPDPLT